MVACMNERTKVPQRHREILDQRWNEYRSGKVKRITLKELERRLDKR
ncbi:addiction module protein [Prosthecobacter sp.]